MKICTLFVFLLVSAGAWAQTDEGPANNRDLRHGTALLVLENFREEDKLTIERSSTGDHWLVLVHDGEVTRSKLKPEDAQSFDGRFSAAFLKVQYELGEDPKGCDAQWRLVLRGDEYKFCSKNEQKDQVVRPLYVELRKAAADS